MAHEVETGPAAASSTPSPPVRMTYEEFLRIAPEDRLAEWVDGEMVLMSPATKLHQRIALFLSRLLADFVENGGLGEVLVAPFQMKTGPDLPGREPDVFFVASEHLDRIKNTNLDGPADLAVEVISADSRSRDRGDKFDEYEQGGVPEYWLIDPERKRAEFYQRGADGFYRSVPIGQNGIYHSAVLQGLWVKVDWLWQDPLPPLRQVVKEWGLVQG
jgi:Uma2 family endonuclease